MSPLWTTTSPSFETATRHIKLWSTIIRQWSLKSRWWNLGRTPLGRCHYRDHSHGEPGCDFYNVPKLNLQKKAQDSQFYQETSHAYSISSYIRCIKCSSRGSMVEALKILWHNMGDRYCFNFWIYLLGGRAMVNMDHCILILLHHIANEESRWAFQIKVREKKKYDLIANQRGKRAEISVEDKGKSLQHSWYRR